MKLKNIALGGDKLKLEELYGVVKKNTPVELSKKAETKINASFNFLHSELQKEDKILYGINTGFGPMASYILPKKELLNLQKNLILSHATGMGNKLPDEFVLSAMTVRLNTLCQGYSGVSRQLLDLLVKFINHKIIPFVPEHGAVGTSGDLVQLAHIALSLIGLGKVSYRGKILSTAQVLKKLNIKPHELKVKEGLALINGTAMMSGIAGMVAFEAEKLLRLNILAGCLALEIVNGFNESFSKKLQEVRPHSGQIYVAQKMREILKNSRRIVGRQGLHKNYNSGQTVNKIPVFVQEVYSLRCISQILGPFKESLDQTRTQIETEINSATDNPIIDWENKEFLHGGNFHGEYTAQAMDKLKIGLSKLAMLSERRINFFLNPNIQKGLPPFLNLGTPGLTLGLQGLQFVATSTTAHNQTLSYPMSLHSISTNGDNQDVVSMGTDSAIIANKVLENSYIVQTIELITLCQAVDCLKIQNALSSETKVIYELVRRNFPTTVQDRESIFELQKTMEALKTYSL